MIGDMFAVGVEVIVAPLGSSVTMLFVRCCVQSNFEIIAILLTFKDKSISCYMQLQLIIRHGEKSHHTLILNDGGSL